MRKLAVLLLFLTTLCSCSQRFSYRFVDAEVAKKIPADSLKWSYSGGVVSSLPVMDRQGDVHRLYIDERTLLIVRTVDRDEYRFRLPTVVVEDNGDGLLGATTSWRGYDTRQGANRSVFVREVGSSEILSPIPASQRILPR